MLFLAAIFLHFRGKRRERECLKEATLARRIYLVVGTNDRTLIHVVDGNNVLRHFQRVLWLMSFHLRPAVLIVLIGTWKMCYSTSTNSWLKWWIGSCISIFHCTSQCSWSDSISSSSARMQHTLALLYHTHACEPMAVVVGVRRVLSKRSVLSTLRLIVWSLCMCIDELTHLGVSKGGFEVSGRVSLGLRQRDLDAHICRCAKCSALNHAG
jgi:hypothetical protein